MSQLNMLKNKRSFFDLCFGTSRKSLISLVVLVLISCLFIFGAFIFQQQYFIFGDIGSDTKDSYLMAYNNIVNNIQNGQTSMWDFTTGMGASILSGQSIVFDPFSLIVYAGGLLFGISSIPAILIYVHILKIICASLLCYAFLNCFKISNASKVIAAYLYAFSGFMMLWGQHYFFASAVVLLPAVLLAIEKAPQNKKFLFVLCALTFILTISSVYTAYMILLTGAVYAIIRYFLRAERHYLKGFIFQFLPMVGAVILGVLLAGFILLPSAYIITGVSIRLEDERSLWEKFVGEFTHNFPPEYYRTLTYRMLSNNLLGTGNFSQGYFNYYEDPQVFFSSLFILLFPQYLVNIFRKKQPVSKKVLLLISVGLLASVVLLIGVSSILKAFAGWSLRSSYMIFPFCALLVGITLDDIFRKKLLNVPLLVISIAGCVWILIMAYLKQRPILYPDDPAMASRVEGYIVAFICIVIILGILLGISAKRKKVRKSIIFILLACVVVYNVCMESYITNNERGLVDKTLVHELYYGDMKEAADFVKDYDDGFYRVEKDMAYLSLFSEASTYEYNGVSEYNSVMNRNLTEFKKKLWPEIRIDREPDSQAIYFMDDMQHNIFESLLDIKYILTVSNEYDETLYEPLAQFGTVTVLKNKNAVSFGILFNQAVSAENYEMSENLQKEDFLYQTVIVNDGKKTDLLKSMEQIEESGAVLKLPNVGQTNFVLDKETSTVSGEVTAQDPGILMLSIPYEGGWEVYVNGEKANMLRVDYGFIGVELSQGTYQIEARYSTPYGKEGLLISCIGCFILAIWGVLTARRSRTIKNKQNINI